MSNIYKDFFDQISINGRYIYLYISLLNYLSLNKLTSLPDFLTEILEDFACSYSLDEWQAIVEEVRPSFILTKQFSKHTYELINEENYKSLETYYNKINKESLEIIENLIWIGMSNIYLQFESHISMEYFLKAITILTSTKTILPDFSIVENLHISQCEGWGNRAYIRDYLR